MTSRCLPTELVRSTRGILRRGRSGRWRLVALALAVVLSASLGPPPRSAGALDSTVVVLRTEDAALANPASAVCTSTLPPVGECTLRAAVQAANNSGFGVHTIQLAKAGTYKITLGGREEENAATGDLDIKLNISIENTSGGTVVIDGNQADRVFDVRPGGKLSLSNVNITGGFATNPPMTTNGNGGAIRAETAELSIVGGQIFTNQAANVGGGIYAFDTRVVMSGVKVRQNSAATSGGGVYVRNPAGSATLTTLIDASWIDANHAVYVGGGLFATGPLMLFQSLINNNIVDDPGGVYAWGGGIAHQDGIAFIRNTTISTNYAQLSASPSGQAGLGGGLHVSGPSTVWLNGSTLAYNEARKSGGGIHETDDAGTSVRLANTIVAENVAPSPALANCRLPVTSNGYNLEAHSVSGFSCLTAPQATDLRVLNARLGVLSDPDGNIPFHALLAGSQAIDAGNPSAVSDADLTSSVCPTTDQRNLPRPKDGDGNGQARCDIGAYELFKPYSGNLGLTATNNTNGVAQGSSVTYTIKASNSGPDFAGAARVVATFPAALTSVSWTCSAAGQSLCSTSSGTTSSGTGNIDALVDLAVGHDVTFSATGTVASGASGNLAVTASVAPPAGLLDPTPANNGANETDPIGPPVPAACVSKQRVLLSTAPTGDGRLRVTVTTTAGPLQSVQFGNATNALVEIPGTTPGAAGNFLFTPPADATQVTFFVRRVNSASASTVAFVVLDSCGAWPTFVGGGAGAF